MSSGGAARGAAEGRGACGQRAGGEARTTTGGWGRAAKGQAERQAPCAARKGGGVRKTGRRSRAPEKAAQTATRARRQRPTPASSAPAPADSAPRPQAAPPRPPAALHVRQRCSRSRKAAPTAPSVHNRHPAPGKPYKQRPAPTNPAPHPKKPRQPRPAPAGGAFASGRIVQKIPSERILWLTFCGFRFIIFIEISNMIFNRYFQSVLVITEPLPASKEPPAHAGARIRHSLQGAAPNE